MSLFTWVQKYLVYIVIGICLIGGWYAMRAKQVMHTRPRYTIGYLTGSIYRPNSGKSYSYSYQVKGTEYEATDISETGMLTKNGSRFVVEYDSLDPTVSTGHFSATVPASIPASPPSGWKTSPVPIPKLYDE
jgi:hypothetical protein